MKYVLYVKSCVEIIYVYLMLRYLHVYTFSQHYTSPKYTTNTCAWGKECGHHTQVVWAETRRVGCVVHDCASNRGATYAICNYNPPGNYEGQRPY